MSLTPLRRLSVFFESALHKVEAILRNDDRRYQASRQGFREVIFDLIGGYGVINR